MSYVLLEGVDGSGKTTLAHELQDVYSAHVYPIGPPRTDMTVLGEHLRYSDFHNLDGRCVFDRFHLGTWAYGKEFRPEKDVEGIGDFYQADWELLEANIRRDCVLVLCDPGWEKVREVWNGRASKAWEGVKYAEYEADLQVVKKVWTHFKDAYHYSALRKFFYDWTREGDWQNLTGYLYDQLGWTV